MAYYPGAKTGQQIAASRYTPVASTTPPMDAGPLIADATQTSRVEKCDYQSAGTPVRQISETGKVTK